MMKHLILILSLLLLLVARSFSQDFIYDRTSIEELQLSRYDNDTSAKAIVLKEFGTTRIGSDDGTPVYFDYHVRIKIFNTKGFEHGNVVIPIYKSDNNRFESVSEIEGITVSYSNGRVVKSALDPKKVFTEQKNKYWELVKFAMPNLTEGCIVEYRYQIKSPFKFNFRKWEFQSDIPKIYSEYIANIPSAFNYNVTLIGYQKLTKSNSELVKDCFEPGGGFKADCSKMTYIMANIPAFVEEDYMTAASNFKSAITFELSDYVDYTGVKHKVTQEWKDIDYELKKSEGFGLQIKKKDLFKESITSVLKNTSDELSKAKAVYFYIQKWFKWNNFYSSYSDDGIRKAIESHSGSVADINIALVAALSAAGLNTETVLLSTRENGVINKLYPVISDFNYVLAKVNIGDKSYLLDATDPLLSFGMLPIRCINDQGRVISNDKASYWIDMVAQQKETSVYTVNLSLKDNGKMLGTITCFSIGYAAYNKRRAIKKFNSVEEYVENLDEKMPKLKILKSEIENLDSLEITLFEKYEVEINAYDNLNKSKFVFSPFFIDPIKENPFKLTERNFPVDWGAPSESRMTITLTYPENFSLSSNPAPVGASLPLNGGSYIANYANEGNQISFSQIIKLNKSVYQPDEYPYLKELFNKIVTTQKSEVIFSQKQ